MPSHALQTKNTPRNSRRLTAQRNERGSISIWTVLLTGGAFTLLLGLVVDGGNIINERLDATRIAQQAARAGADALSPGSVRSGGNNVDPIKARNRAEDYLATAGVTGTVTVNGDKVTVTVTGNMPTQILGVLGVETLPISQTESAHGIVDGD